MNNKIHDAWKWSWQFGDLEQTYWVEKKGEKKIVKWESNDGQIGEMINSIRVPYWRLHDNKDLPYREKLGIPKF